MVIEVNLIENFILATVVVGLLAVFAIFVKNALKKKHVGEAENNMPNHESDLSHVAKSPEDQKNMDNPDYMDIIKAAQKHAEDLLEETTRAASEMIAGGKQTNEHIEAQMDKVLQKIAADDIHSLKTTSSQFDREYKETLQDIQKQLQDAAYQAVENSKNTYNEKIETFTKELVKNGLSMQTTVDKKTAELLAKTESEIEEYKKSKLNKVDEEINTLVQKVYRDVLRTSIPENAHEEMIVKSLEEAKKDGMFKL
ncbi:MAG TPA: hypothetical protein VNA13_02715 [Xanthomonadales bacterium]|nr:hypothetical protein [Xanthomonadales bacterium]